MIRWLLANIRTHSLRALIIIPEKIALPPYKSFFLLKLSSNSLFQKLHRCKYDVSFGYVECDLQGAFQLISLILLDFSYMGYSPL